MTSLALRFETLVEARPELNMPVSPPYYPSIKKRLPVLETHFTSRYAATPCRWMLYGSVKSVAVVGGGISGLAAAYKLKSQGLNVTLFEAEERAGGKLRSVSRDGLIWDEGANTMMESDMEVGRLLDNLGLREKQQFPISQSKRYVVRNGEPELIPTNPFALMRSNLLSTKSKFQIILEPFLWRSSAENTNLPKMSNESLQESVREFFQRHFGDEVVDYLIDPFVAGTSAGDPDSLSMPHAFPELWNLEKKFGSIIVGAFRSKMSGKQEKREKETSSEKSKQQRGSFSFHGGMQRLADMLSNDLGDNLKLKSKVLSLSYNHDENSPSDNWSVSYATNHKEPSPDQSFDAVIMTAPLCNVKEMKITREGSPFMLDFLPEVTYLPLSVVVTTFKKENVKRPLEGFGILIPSKEQQNGLKTLVGTLFSSMVFPDRAPSDLYLYTTFVGGSRNRDLAKASLDELKQVVTSDLRKLLGAEGEPTFVNHFYWSKAFPLYGHDYNSVLEAIEKMERSLPGLFYAAIASGCKAADLVISYLNSSSDEKLVKEASIAK
ncbi:Amine oxidase [Macleaya cordata]|uniref:Protoporphyrinogen oxidase n=1 Tax=Macleaya cordata TaxID=56857 RepID=A0A200QYE0_MACCD|nr:Amine oxidase [Macleaya cordata]